MIMTMVLYGIILFDKYSKVHGEIMSFAIIIWLQKTAHRIRSFRCYGTTIDYIINDTFKDNLQKNNNMIQLEKIIKKKQYSVCSISIE